jgi:hypothetical protein
MVAQRATKSAAPTPMPTPPGGTIPLFPPGFPAYPPYPPPFFDLDRFIDMVTASVRLDLGAVRELSDAKQKELLKERLESLKTEGLLTTKETEALIKIGGGGTSTRSISIEAFTPDGSPSLCGVLAVHIRNQPEERVSGAGIITVGLSAAGGATIGYLVGGPIGGLAGAAFGGSIAASAVQ